METQKLLFEILEHKTPDNQRLAKTIGELLGIGADSTYRRIRGETELSFSELIKICETFNISIDELLTSKSDQSVLFHYTPFETLDQMGYIGQLQQLLNLLNDLKSASTKEIVYVARNIPFFHLLPHPELALLDLYSWDNALNFYDESFERFCNHIDMENIISLYQQIYHAYMFIPSKEIWNIQTVGGTLRLVKYFFESGAFEKKDTALHLLDQLVCLLDSINNYADRGLKGDEQPTPFFMYDCLVDLNNNSYLTSKEGQLTLTVMLHTVDSIETDNKSLCNIAHKAHNDLIAKSTLISGESSVKKRHRFFKTAQNKTQELIEKIKSDP